MTSIADSDTVVPSIAEQAEPIAAEGDEDEIVVLDVHSHGGNEWFMDDFPCSGPAYMELSQEDKNIVEWAMTRRSVAVRDITYYVYCRNVAAWAQMESPTAAHELTDVANINAPVNYAAALQRFYPLLTRMAFPIEGLTTSVCIGTYRFTFEVKYLDDGPVVYYAPHATVIPNPRGDEHRRMYMFVTSPIVMSFPFRLPKTMTVDLEGEILNQILLPLRDDQKLDFMWRIGNALTDPVRNPCVIIFYGATGEEGKSVLATNISRVLGRGVEWTVMDLIGKASKWPDGNTVMKLAEKRLVICDECGIEEDMNYNNIKRWTSNAPVQSDQQQHRQARGDLQDGQGARQAQAVPCTGCQRLREDAVHLCLPLGLEHVREGAHVLGDSLVHHLQEERELRHSRDHDRPHSLAPLLPRVHSRHGHQDRGYDRTLSPVLRRDVEQARVRARRRVPVHLRVKVPEDVPDQVRRELRGEAQRHGLHGPGDAEDGGEGGLVQNHGRVRVHEQVQDLHADGGCRIRCNDGTEDRVLS
jgi:DNA-directed RNA polymerase subunit M/transcription elongation factor TFIIS